MTRSGPGSQNVQSPHVSASRHPNRIKSVPLPDSNSSLESSKKWSPKLWGHPNHIIRLWDSILIIIRVWKCSSQSTETIQLVGYPHDIPWLSKHPYGTARVLLSELVLVKPILSSTLVPWPLFFGGLIHATKQELAKAEEHIWVNSEKNNDSTISGHNDPILSILFPA